MNAKPTRFSDPYCDWDGCENELNAILLKDEDDLVADDYHVIFARHLPAADYKEGMHYIPYCLDYLSEGREIHASRYPDSLLWWIHNYMSEMKADGQWAAVIQHLERTCIALVSDFELFDLSEEECAQMGRDHGYSIRASKSIFFFDHF